MRVLHAPGPFSVDGHYGCDHVVAVVSRAAVNFAVPMSFSNRHLSVNKPPYISE